MKEENNNRKKPNNISQRVILIQSGNEDINDFIVEYIPFIKSCASKVCKRQISKDSEELSIALLGFNEAIKSYDSQKGQFLSFSNWVIRRRIIDFIRKESRNKETPYSSLTEAEQSQYENVSDDDCLYNNPLKQEIEFLIVELNLYGIEFEELVSTSPKAKKTKAACASVVEFIASNPDIFIKMQKNKRIPIKKIKENLRIPRKLLERHRKYIIAATIILKGDYIYLREYIPLMKGGKH